MVEALQIPVLTVAAPGRSHPTALGTGKPDQLPEPLSGQFLEDPATQPFSGTPVAARGQVPIGPRARLPDSFPLPPPA